MNKMIVPILLSVFIAAAPPASADEVDDLAATLFKEGKREFENLNYTAAARAFRDAYRLRPSWKLLYNIAQSEAAAKNYGLALDAFERYLAEGGDAIPAARESEVADEMGRLKLKVGNLALKAPAGATILINDTTRGTTPLPGYVRLASGREHHLVVKQGEEVLLDRRVRIGSEETLEVIVNGNPDAAVASNNPEDKNTDTPASETDTTAEKADHLPKMQTSSSHPLKVTGWSLIGAGGALLIAGSITGGITMAKSSKLQEDCPNKVCDDPDAKDRHSTTKNLAIATDILLVAGGVTAATGLVLLLVDRKRQRNERAARVTPFANASAAGFLLQGQF
ncbi:MAG: hypothetical protein JXR76_32265 [Deltaproteobacteria bacterium]|nr:hypothetical protein [Deltaproteobacteria bacterium]